MNCLLHQIAIIVLVLNASCSLADRPQPVRCCLDSEQHYEKCRMKTRKSVG